MMPTTLSHNILLTLAPAVRKLFEQEAAQAGKGPAALARDLLLNAMGLVNLTRREDLPKPASVRPKRRSKKANVVRWNLSLNADQLGYLEALSDYYGGTSKSSILTLLLLHWVGHGVFIPPTAAELKAL